MSCATLATETQFGTQLVTSNSLSTSFSTSVTTIPGTTVTSTSTICLDSNATDTSSCATPAISTFVTTSPGSTSTVSVPITITVPVTITSSAATRTLFSTSCSSTPTSPASPNSTPSSTSTSTSATSSSSTTTSRSSSSSPTSTPTQFTSLSTPPPLISTIASSLTLSNGSVVTTDIVLTTTLPPSSVVVVATAPSLNDGGGGGSSGKTAPIVGGVVGGVVGLLALIGGIWFMWRRSKRWKDIFDQEAEEKEQRRPRMSLDGEDMEPRPYHYGLVGHSTSPTPPSSPPLAAVQGGHSPSNSLSLLNIPANQHSRSSSALTVPSPGPMSRSLSDLGYAPSAAGHSGHVRPNLSTSSSAAASTRPLLERSVNQSRPPSSWSTGGQSTGTGAEFGASGKLQTAPLSPRPHSAGGNLQSARGSSAAGGAVSPTSMEAGPSPRSSPVNEKRRLRAALPLGAAAPTPPAPTIPLIPGPRPPSAQSPSDGAPPILPRNPNRPSSTKNQDMDVLVHLDGGPAGSSNERHPEGRAGNAPPAYSPT